MYDTALDTYRAPSSVDAGSIHRSPSSVDIRHSYDPHPTHDARSSLGSPLEAEGLRLSSDLAPLLHPGDVRVGGRSRASSVAEGEGLGIRMERGDDGGGGTGRG